METAAAATTLGMCKLIFKNYKVGKIYLKIKKKGECYFLMIGGKFFKCLLPPIHRLLIRIILNHHHQ